MIKPATVRVVLCLALSHNWKVRRLDVNNTFLHGTLSEDVYMEQPSRFIDPLKPDHVCKLNKAIYGLKQGPWAWYTKLKNFLCSYGFKMSLADPSLFLYKNHGITLYLLIYVDDIILTRSNEAFLGQFVHSLASTFSLKDLGELSYFLGVEVVPTQTGVFLCQQNYITDILHKTNMMEAKAIFTPTSVHSSLSLTDGSPLRSAKEYRQVVGSLQYLQITRPDIAYCVNKFSQFMHQPTDVDWSAVKRLLRYLQGTKSLGLSLCRHSPLALHAF